MIPGYKPYATKFGIRLDASSALKPSATAIVLLITLHLGAGVLLWQLSWPYWLCILGNIMILPLMGYSLNQAVFSITRYQFSFFFTDKNGWMILENENLCYRASLRYAFCGKYLVILIFDHRLVLPIFFDSLPPAEFRQLRKVLILLDYVNRP